MFSGFGREPVRTVKGGESFDLRGGVRVHIERVTYLDRPCPQGVMCIHSGMIKTVGFSVERRKEGSTDGRPRRAPPFPTAAHDVTVTALGDTWLWTTAPYLGVRG